MTARRLSLCRLALHFRHDRSGTSAIEFALLAAPFFIFLLLVLEVGLVFLVGQGLENATQDAARLIRTGQAQTFTRESFTEDICDRLWMFPDCPTALKVDVRVADNFGSADFSTPIRDGALDDRDFDFDAGVGDDIIVVRAFYPWPVLPALPALIRFLGLQPELPPTGFYLLLSTAVFRNEPFS